MKKKQAPGLKEQILEGKTLSLVNLEKYLMNIFKTKPADHNVKIGQWCRTQGFIERVAGVDLKICNDPECVSCSMFRKAINDICT